MTFQAGPGQAIVAAQPNATNNAGSGKVLPTELATTNFQVLSVSARKNVKKASKQLSC